MLPPQTKTGIEVMSVNLLVDDETKPVVWRGPVIAGTVKQFWSEVVWNDVDYMFVDMPPGTGDVPLTVFQCIPLDGIVIVSTPQELVSMIVEKAANMAKMMQVDVVGLVENMSYVKCPDCDKQIKIFGESHIEEIAEKYGYPLLAKMPIDPTLASLVDAGQIEKMDVNYLDGAVEVLKTVKSIK
jgi:Mrp family chromosome partitioning ATPase